MEHSPHTTLNTPPTGVLTINRQIQLDVQWALKRGHSDEAKILLEPILGEQHRNDWDLIFQVMDRLAD